MVDSQLRRLYDQHRSDSASAIVSSGYVWSWLFRKEQRWVLEQMRSSYVTATEHFIVDAGCGAGVMVQPLVQVDGYRVVGVDFDPAVLSTAKAMGIKAVHGDVFALPLADASVQVVLCTQFLNQQTEAGRQRLLAEFSRILAPEGIVVLTWRKDDAVIHQLAQWVLHRVGSNFAEFPQFRHDWDELVGNAEDVGLTVLNGGVMTLLGSTLQAPDSGRIMGISYGVSLGRTPSVSGSNLGKFG